MQRWWERQGPPAEVSEAALRKGFNECRRGAGTRIGEGVVFISEETALRIQLSDLMFDRELAQDEEHIFRIDRKTEEVLDRLNALKIEAEEQTQKGRLVA